VNERNLSDVRRETSRHFRNKKREYLKDEVNDIEPNSKNKNIRNLYAGITEYKKGYQSATNLVKYETGDLLADRQQILTRWKNYFSQLEVEVALRKMNRYKAPGSDQIPAELIQAGGGGGNIAFGNT
jgi:hypothetical protein